MAKILVTGYCGFIGSHLTQALKHKHELFGVDLVAGSDILNLTPDDFEGVDYVFHLAAKAKVPYSFDYPLDSNENNVEGTLNVLECARVANVKRVIYSASSSAYGDQDTLPLVETMTPNPMSPYGAQKLMGEYYCKIYSEFHGLDTVSLRYFNVYGEGMRLDGAYSACLAIFLDQKERGVPLSVFGGKQKRDFTYVGDVVNANILAMKSRKKLKGEVINIGTGTNYSIKELAEAISDQTDFLPQRKGEPMETRADNKKAKQLLKWEPQTNLLKWLKEITFL